MSRAALGALTSVADRPLMLFPPDSENDGLKAATPAKDQRHVFKEAIAEINNRCKPDLVIISAGFDAHEADPLGQLRLEDEDFVSMTRVVK